ncbi:hypothetical protein AOLI_G00052300 [Acnodon oligacanthus]
MSEKTNIERSALRRIVKLPLVSSTLQMVTGIYVGAKHRYPLLGVVGAMTELSVRSISMAASQRAAPLLQRLEPEIETVNGYALVGLEQLEKTFPIFHQSADEVIEYMKESFFLRLEDAQYRVNVELDNMVDRWQKVLKFTWDVMEAAQASAAGQVLTSGLDELLTRSEEAVAYNLPLPPTLRREWEIRLQSYEDEDGNEDDDDDGEPRMWTRIRSLLFYVYLQMYHRFLMLKKRVDSLLEFLGEAADVVEAGWSFPISGAVSNWGCEPGTTAATSILIHCTQRSLVKPADTPERLELRAGTLTKLVIWLVTVLPCLDCAPQQRSIGPGRENNPAGSPLTFGRPTLLSPKTNGAELERVVQHQQCVLKLAKLASSSSVQLSPLALTLPGSEPNWAPSKAT